MGVFLMRKIIALSLSALMILLTVMPVGIFAQAERERELEEVIKAVKRKFDIPEELNFTDYYVGTNEKGVRTWSLSWRDKEKDIGMSVGITDKGVITRYSFYEPYKEIGKKFPAVSEEEALETAESFINEIAPAGTLGEIRRQDETDGQILFLKNQYNFKYYRVVNGIPYYSNGLSITVNSETGKVIHYNYNIDEDLIFPSLGNIITLEDAKKAYENNLGLKLVYKYYYDYKKEKIDVYPAYVPKYDNETYAIDAATGEKIRTGVYYYDEIRGMGANMDVRKEEKDMLAQAAGGTIEPVLTPEELEAARKQAQLLTEKEAEGIVREAPETGIDSGYVLRSINLSKGWPEKDKFVYNMSFRKEIEGENKEGYRSLYASASINAKTGEILGFYTDNMYLEEEPGFDKDAARAEVEKFLQGFKPEKFAETLLEEQEEEYVVYRGPETKPQRYYYFIYIRQVNGIPFPDNGFNVTFDGVQGKVTSFSMNWFDIDFPGLENAISREDAHAALYKNIGLELQYKQVGVPGDVIPLPMDLPYGDIDSATDSAAGGAAGGATDEKPGDAVLEGDDTMLESDDGEQPDADGDETGTAQDAGDAAGGNGEAAGDGDGIAEVIAEAAENGAGEEGNVTVTIGESGKDIASLPTSIDSALNIKIPEIKAVYALKSGKPFVLDAYTGNILDYNGKPYKENKPPEYNDIPGHFAEEQIKTLAKYGIISFSSPEYRPNEKIIQKDYLMILSNILDNYYGPVIKEDSEQDDIDEMYKQLIREGIIEEDEKSPESLITREDAVKFIIRALKYREVAEIEGIFIVPFSDEEDITPTLKGYVAIASGLKIVSGSGGKFYPKNNLTRGEAAVMVYNYLNKQ
jgi:hypothetical protein